MAKHILLVGSSIDMKWIAMIQDIIVCIGELEIVDAEQVQSTLGEKSFDLLLIDISSLDHPVSLVSSLHTQYQPIPILVATASPTWRRARDMFKAGANDYIEKSLNKRKLQTSIWKALQIYPLKKSNEAECQRRQQQHESSETKNTLCR